MPFFFINRFRKLILVICIVGLNAVSANIHAQVLAEPSQERLLNGLRVLIFSRPSDKNVLLKLRIHSGAAFDMAGKTGQMAILGDLLFPDPATREFFAEELAGKLDVITDHDSITVSMHGRANEFVRMVEILRTALINTQITPDNVAKVRDGRIKIVKETNVSPAALADRAIAARLLGDFPYGRAYSGTAESLARVERADLMLARDRFLNPNNATLVVSGGVQRNSALRALRQLLGSWRMSEQIVPTTFRQPDLPDTRTLIINAPAEQSAEVRVATRGVARADADFPAAAIMASLARRRWEALSPELSRSPAFVRNESHVLPGMFVMGAAVDSLLAGKVLKTARQVLKSLVDTPVSPTELEQLKSEVLAQAQKDRESPEGIARDWLDIDTFRLPPVSDQIKGFSSVIATDIQRVAAKLFRESAIASIVLGDSKQLKAQLEPNMKIELMGEIVPPPRDAAESKPASTIPVKKPD